MAKVEGGAWKATNDKNGVGTLSYVIGPQTVAKVAGLATLKQAGGSIYVVDPTTGETNLLSDGVDYGIDIEPMLATAEGASSTVTSYTGTFDLSQKIIGTSKLTLTNGNYKLDSDDADLVDDTVFKTSKLKISLPDKSKVKIESGSEDLDTYNKSKGTLTVTGNLTGGYAIAKDGLTATYQAFKSGQTVATISGLRTGLTGDDWKSTIALTTKASENSDSDGGYNGLITLSKLAKAAEGSDGEPTYTTAGSVLGNTAIKVTTNATLANNGTNYYLGLSAANKGKHGYAQGELSEYENEAKWTINKTTATYKIDLPVGYQLATAAGATVKNETSDADEAIGQKATQIKVTAAKPETIATVTNLLSGLEVSNSGKSVGVYAKIDINGDSDDSNDFLTGLTADFTLPSSEPGDKGEVEVKIGRNALPTAKATVQAAAGRLFSLTGGEVALENSYGTVPTVKPNPAINENDYLDIWVISGTTATLKRVTSAYYTLNGNKIASVAQTTGQVLATIKNLNKEWLADENNLTRVVIGNANTPITAIKGIELSTDYKDNYEFKNNKWVVKKEGGQPVGIGTITLSNQVLTTKSVTIGASDNFKLFVRQEDDSGTGLSAVSTPGFYDRKWNLSGTTATYKGGISAGYIVSNDGKTITYTAEGKNQTLATITGLKKGVVLTVDSYGKRTIGYTTNGGFSYGIQTTFDNSNDSDDALTYHSDSGDADTYHKLDKLDITLSRNVLGTTKVAITSNFFKLAIDKDASDEDHFVADSIYADTAGAKIDWHGTLGTNATLRSTREAYYTVNNTVNKWGQDITYTPPATDGTTLAIVKGLNSGITKDDISFNTLSGAITIENENAVTTKSITLTGGGYSQGVAESLKVAGKFYLALGESSGLSAPVLSGGTWTQATTKGNPITFKAEVTEGYQVSSDSMAINYTAASTNPKVLASITGLKGNLGTVEGGGISIPFAGVSFSKETGVITLGMQALNDANVKLTNSNYSLSIASDVPTEKGSDGNSWVISGTTATYKKVGGNAYYELTDNNTLNYNPAADVAASLKKNYVTITGLKSGLTVSKSGQSIGYYNASGSFVTAIMMDLTTGEAESITGGKLTIVDEAALTTGNVKISDKASLTSVAGFSIGLGASLAQKKSAQLKYGSDLTWSITNKGVATYKGNVKEYYTNDTDNKGITYHAAKDNAVIATITNLATTLGSYFKPDGNVVSANGSASGLVVDDDTREIAIYSNMLGTSTVGAVLTTNIAISGASAYKFKLGSDVETYAGVSSKDDAVWVIANAKNATSTTATRSIWTQAHYSLSGGSTTLTYKPTGVSKELAKIDGLAKGLGTIKGGEINGLSVAGTSSTGLGLDTGVVTFLTDDVIISKKDVTLTDLDPSDNINYSLSIAEDIASIKPQKSQVYQFGGAAADSFAVIEMYHADSEGYKVVSGQLPVTISGASATLNTSTLQYNEKTGTNQKLVTISGLKKRSELTPVTVATANGASIGGFDGITFDRSTGTFKVSNVVLDISDVTATNIATASLAGFSLALDEDVPAPLANGPGWKIHTVQSGSKVNTVAGAFELYDNCSAPGYSLTSATQITYKSSPSGSGNKLGASISGLASNLPINSYQIAGISISSDKTITLSKNVLDGKDVKLENLNSGNYKLAIVGVSTADGYVAPPSVSAVWNYTNTTGTATYKESMKEGYELSSDGLSVEYTPTTIVTSTLTGLSREKVSLINGGMSISGISFADGVFTITDSDVLANKKVTLTSKDSKNKNVDGYKLALGKGVGARKDPLTWNKTETDTKATLTQVTKSGYTVSTDGKAINYSSDPTTATLMTITGLKKANVSASAVSDDDDYASTIKGIVIGSFSDTGSESAIGHESAYSLASAFAKNASGGYVKISKDVLTNTNVTLGKNDNYKLVLDADGDDAVATAAEESQAWSVKKTIATYNNIKTPYYTLTNDKTITYKAASIGGGIVTIGGLRSGLVPNAAGSIAGIKITGTTVTLSAEALPTDAGTVTISSDYALDLGDDVAKVNSSTSIAADVVTITAEGTTRESVNAWVEEGSNYVYRLYNPGYYTLGKTNDTVGVNNKITSTAAKTLVNYFTITGLSAGMSLTESDIAFTNDSDYSKGGIITISKGMLDDKTVKLTSNYNFKLSVEGGVSAANLSFADNPWNVKGTNATLKGTYGKGYALSEDGKTLTYYSKEDGTIVNLATLTGLKSSAPLNKDVLVVSGGFSATKADSVINITLDKTQLGTAKVALKGDHFKLAVNDKKGKVASQTEDPTWIKANNATTATYTQTTYAGFSPSADGKTLNYLSKTTPVNLVTITGLNKALTTDDMIGGDSAALDEVEKAIELNKTDKTITVAGLSALTTANMTLGKNDAYKFVFTDIKRDYIDPSITPYDGKGTANIKDGHTASYTQTNDKTITYAKATSTVLASISNLPKNTIAAAGLSLGTGTDSLKVTIDTRALSRTATAAKLTNASKDTTYQLILASAGDYTVPTATARNPKWTNYDAAKGNATLKSVMTEGYKLGPATSLTSGASKGAMTQTVTYAAEEYPTILTALSGLPKNALELDKGTLYMKDTKAEAFTFGTGANSVQVEATSHLTGSIQNKGVETTLKLSGGTVDYYFSNNTVSGADAGSTISNAGTTQLNFGNIASGKAVYGNATAASWAKTHDETNKVSTYKYTPDNPGTIVTINGLATTATDSNVKASADHKQVTVSAGALTNSKVTFTYPTTTSEKYEFVLGDDVYTTVKHEDQWKNQIDWVTSGGTATYKLYNKANYTLSTVRGGGNQINYVAPTKGSAFAAISGLNKTTASITSDDVGVDGVISLTADDLNASKVTLNITNVKKVSDSIVAASIKAGNETAANFTLTLTGNFKKSTVSNEYWDTTKTTAKLTGSISEGYRLATNKKSVLYYSKDADGQTIATITGLKKNAEIDSSDVSPSSDDPLFITNVSLGSDQLTTTKVALKGEGYKLKLDTSTTNSVISADNISAWQNQEGWFASNGTFTYKKHNKAYYTVNALGTEITYTAQKDVQQHAVIAGLNKTVTSASDYATIDTTTKVITLDDDALNKAKITLTDKDLGGYTLALANTSSLSTATVDAAISGTGNNIKATWIGTQGAGYLLGNDAQTFTYINAAKAATVAVVTGLAAGKTADDLNGKYNASNNVVTLADSDLNTVKKATISGTAAFSFSDDVDGHTITGSAAADRVTIAGDTNVFNAAAGNDWIEIGSGTANSINAGAGNDRILVGSANNSIVAGDGSDRIILSAEGNTVNAGKGNDYINFGSGTGANTFFYANGDGADVIANFKEGDTFKVTNLAQNKISVSDSGNDVIVKVNGTSVKLLNVANIKFNITDKDNATVAHTVAGGNNNNILADDNYSMTPQLSSIVKGSTTYMTEDLVATDATSLTKQSTAIAYSGKK